MSVLLGILLLIAPFVVIGALVSLSARVKQLENQVSDLTRWLEKETVARAEDRQAAAQDTGERQRDPSSQQIASPTQPAQPDAPALEPIAGTRAPVSARHASAAFDVPPQPRAQVSPAGGDGSTASEPPPSDSHPAPTRAPSTQSIPEEELDSRVIAWFKENWLMKVGALFLVMGFGWLVSYAFANDWIGPLGRIVLGWVAGAAFMGLGWWRIQTYRDQGSVFMVLGSTIVLLVTYAGQALYALMPGLFALVLMFATSALVAFASVYHRSRGLAIASLIMASIAPLLIGSTAASYTILFSYLLMVVLGTVWVVALSGYRELSLGALLIVFFYSIPHLTGAISAEIIPLFFIAILFSGIFFGTSVLGVMRLPKERTVPDIITAGGNGLFILLWIIAAVPAAWQSVAVLGAAIIFIVAAGMVYRAIARPEPFLTYLGAGIMMIVTATALEFDGYALTIAYIAQSAIAVLSVYVLTGRKVRIAAKVGALFILPGLLSIPSFFALSWREGFLHADLFVLLFMGLALLGVAILLLLHPREEHDESSFALTTLLLVTGTLYLHSILWLAFPSEAGSQLFALALWSLLFVGLAFLVQRLCRDNHSLYPYLFIVSGMMFFAFLQHISGPWLTILYTIQAILIVMVLQVLVCNPQISLRTALILGFPALLSLGSVTSGSWDDGVLHADLLVLLLLGAVLAGLGAYFYIATKRERNEETVQLCGGLMVAGSLYFYIALWLVLHALLPNPDIAVMLALAVYTVVGIATYFWGLHHGISSVRWYGAALLGFVIGRLLLVDVWEMAIVGRIITFFTIGTLLVATAFVSRERMREDTPQEPKEPSNGTYE